MFIATFIALGFEPDRSKSDTYPFSQRWSISFCGLPEFQRFFADVHRCKFLQAIEHRHTVGLHPAILFGNTTHVSSFARASEITLRDSVSSDETSKIPLFRRASRNLVSSSSQFAIYSCCCLFDGLGHSSAQIMSYFGLLWVDRSLMCIHLGRGARPACSQTRHRCLVSLASCHRRIIMEWRRLFHPERATLLDVLRDGDT